MCFLDSQFWPKQVTVPQFFHMEINILQFDKHCEYNGGHVYRIKVNLVICSKIVMKIAMTVAMDIKECKAIAEFRLPISVE